MTAGEKLQRDFFKAMGETTVRAFKTLLDTLPNVAFVMKDTQGRFMALNERNVSIAGFKSEREMLGLTSSDYLPAQIAESYARDDEIVMRTKQPLLNIVHPLSDRSVGSHSLISKVPLFSLRGKLIGVASIYRIVQADTHEGDWYGRFQEVARYIESHYAEDIRMASLLPLAGCARTKFAQLFRRFFNMPVNKYILWTRINHARDLLEHTDLPLSEIALQTGFCDQAHFSRTFQRLRGISPLRHRHNHKTKTDP